MNKLFGFDDNLGLPSRFAETLRLQTKPYHDLEMMIRDFEGGELTSLFLPVGTLPYLKGEYHLIAQATFKDTQSITAVLASAKHLKTLPTPLSSLSFGRINPYCTTSFWGLLIQLMEQGAAPIPLQFTEVDGFHDLLVKTANQSVDASMIWNHILNLYPEEASQLSHLGTITALPTPVIISREPLPKDLTHNLTHFKSQGNHSFFNGFVEVDKSLVHAFLNKMKEASKHFSFQPSLSH